MLVHGPDQLLPAQLGPVQSQLLVLGLVAAHQLARADAEQGEDAFQLLRAGRRLEVFDHDRFDPALAQQLQCLPGFGAARVVINPYFHACGPRASVYPTGKRIGLPMPPLQSRESMNLTELARISHTGGALRASMRRATVLKPGWRECG